MNNEMTEVGTEIEVNIHAAVIRCVNQDWRNRSVPWFRSRIRENIQVLRFLRDHRVYARKLNRL